MHRFHRWVFPVGVLLAAVLLVIGSGEEDTQTLRDDQQAVGLVLATGLVGIGALLELAYICGSGWLAADEDRREMLRLSGRGSRRNG